MPMGQDTDDEADEEEVGGCPCFCSIAHALDEGRVVGESGVGGNGRVTLLPCRCAPGL